MKTITMKRLGHMGQFGNQVVQYAFIRSYAKQHGLRYEVPKWVGQYLFGFSDPPISQHLKPYQEKVTPGNPHMACLGLPIPPADDEVAERDFQGYGQFDTVYYQPHREFIQDLYASPAEPQLSRVTPIFHRLASLGSTIIGLHLRRGDSGRVIYPFTPVGWCLKWLYENWNRFYQPVLFVSTEDPSLTTHFRNYNPVTADDLGVSFTAKEYPGYTYPFPIEQRKSRQLDFFPDWYLLQKCDVILASDSSFSMTAAWTSKSVIETWRPKLSLGRFELTDPWNMHFCNREHLDDYPNIPGTALDDNPGFGWEGFKPTYKAVPEDPATFQQWIKPQA